MGKSRLEAFSDGVIAVIITIMVLELKAPRGTDLADLEPLLPVFLAYGVSFAFVGIYWNSHHHMLQAAREVDGGVLLANLHFLFWLALIPFVTSWVGANPMSSTPTALYGADLLLSGIGFLLLQRALVRRNGRNSALARAIGRDAKGKASALLYAAAMLLAFVRTWISDVLYFLVALIWLIPDRRIEKTLARENSSS